MRRYRIHRCRKTHRSHRYHTPCPRNQARNSACTCKRHQSPRYAYRSSFPHCKYPQSLGDETSNDEILQSCPSSQASGPVTQAPFTHLSMPLQKTPSEQETSNFVSKVVLEKPPPETVMVASWRPCFVGAV